VVNLHSTPFDAYLRIGRTIGGITDYVASDDDGGDNTDALINFRATSRGSYVIVVTSADDTTAKGGEFTLRLVERAQRKELLVRPIAIGDSIAGTLDENSAQWRNSNLVYALYPFSAKKGQPVTARIRTAQGAADVDIVRVARDGTTTSATGSTSVAQVVRFTPNNDGEYAVRVLATGTTIYVVHLEESKEEPARIVQFGRDLPGNVDRRTASGPVPFQVWRMRAAKDERYSIVVSSRDFSTFVSFGRRDADSVVRVASNAQGSTSKIEVSVPLTGEYEIRIEPTGSSGGSYTLRVDTLARVERRLQRKTITSGQEIRGTLVETDAALDDGSPYQEWVYQAKAKERVLFTMRSEEFDTFLSVGRMEAGRYVEFSSNDDAPGDTTGYRMSRVLIVAPSSGTFIIRANSMAINQRGEYTLRAGSPDAEEPIARAINAANRARMLARDGKIVEAISALDSAITMSSAHVTSTHLNTVCWFGSLRNFAQRVLSFCERAVQLDPGNNNIRDSRGVARALTGNVVGAIEDFRAYSGDASNSAASRNQRRGWADALQAGTPPEQVLSESVRAELLRQ
jgi:hypothetical protein